jgi:hypothetical protein
MTPSVDLSAIQVDVARLQEQSKTAFAMLAEAPFGGEGVAQARAR